MSEKSDIENMSNNSSTYSWIFKLLPVIVIAGLIVAAYYFIMSTPLGKGLNSLLGGIGGVLEAIGQQLETCNTNGYFNVKKGCYIGVLSIGVGGLFLIVSIAKGLGITGKISEALKRSFTRSSALSGKEVLDCMAETMEDFDMNKLYTEENIAKYGQEVVDLASKKAVLSKNNRLNLQKGQQNSKSPEELKAATELETKGYINDLQIADQNARDGVDGKKPMTDDEIDKANDLAADNGFEPPPEVV